MPKLSTLSGVRWFLGCSASYVCLRLQSRGLVNQEVWFTSVLGQPRVWFTSGVGEPRVCLTGCLGEPRFGSRGKSGRSEAVPMSILACILQWKCASTFSHGSAPGKARVWFTKPRGRLEAAKNHDQIFCMREKAAKLTSFGVVCSKHLMNHGVENTLCFSICFYCCFCVFAVSPKWLKNCKWQPKRVFQL